MIYYRTIMHIKASSDIFIHYLWGTEKNKDLLISFINTVLEDSEFQPIKDLQIKNPFNRKTFSFDKETVLDINAIDEQGRKEEGKKEGIKETARKILKTGIPVETIMEVTGLKREEIEGLE
jgi:hypothetical protein